MIKNETLSEKWFKFRRYYFKDGFIDIWSGDCANNPNSDKKSKWNLNAFATYARLNGGGNGHLIWLEGQLFYPMNLRINQFKRFGMI